jgi:hypothetical protein
MGVIRVGIMVVTVLLVVTVLSVVTVLLIVPVPTVPLVAAMAEVVGGVAARGALAAQAGGRRVHRVHSIVAAAVSVLPTVRALGGGSLTLVARVAGASHVAMTAASALRGRGPVWITVVPAAVADCVAVEIVFGVRVLSAAPAVISTSALPPAFNAVSAASTIKVFVIVLRVWSTFHWISARTRCPIAIALIIVILKWVPTVGSVRTMADWIVSIFVLRPRILLSATITTLALFMGIPRSSSTPAILHAETGS